MTTLNAPPSLIGPEAKLKLSLPNLLGLVRLGLTQLAPDNRGRRTQVTELRVMNVDVLYCEFIAHTTNSIDLKAEIWKIMSFYRGFFKGEFYEGVQFKRYVIRAVDENHDELMYAVSSKEAADREDAVAWMKSTVLQDNSPDFRLISAKRMISEIENTLRLAMVDRLSGHYGQNWWDIALDNKLGRKDKEQYKNQFGVECSDGSILVAHTYLSQLKDAVLTHWVLLEDLLPSRAQFETNITRLNLLRREEAHNRGISHVNLKELDLIYHQVLPKLSRAYPGALPEYLVDSWRIKITEAFSEPYSAPFSDKEIKDDQSLLNKGAKWLATVRYSIQFLDSLLVKLAGIVVPVQKQQLHNELTSVLKAYADTQQDRIAMASQGNSAALNQANQRLDDCSKELEAYFQKYVLSES